MSRKRDTNWTRDEITVLLDSIMEITQGQADNGTRRTNSREVFEYAAKKLGEKGHSARAEREKCRTKWKKMKEEFNHAKRARETGEGRIAPGIEPFYSRMLEFINGSFDNISPHSTIVRRSSSISSNNNNNNNNNSSNNNNNNNNHNKNNNDNISNSNINNNNNNNNTKNGNSNNHNNCNSSGSSTTAGNNGIVTISNNNHNGNDNVVHHPSHNPTNSSRFSQGASRASARIAANSNGVSSNDASDTSNTTLATNRQNNVEGSNYSTTAAALTFPLSDSSLTPSSRQLLQRPSPVDMNGSNTSMTLMSVVTNRSHLSSTSLNGSAELNHRESSSPGEQVKLSIDCDSVNRNETNPSQTQNPNYSASSINNNHNSSSDLTNHLQPAERDADISYRVSTGCRQITIFGDHDVDIKFRGDCVTINKISADHSTSTPGTMNSDT